MKIIRPLLFSLILLIAAGCDDAVEESIPSLKVKANIDLDVLQLQLNAIGGYALYPQAKAEAYYIGYGGLLIVHGFDDSFYAFDLACPVECSQEVLLEIQDDVKAVCPECGSSFDMIFYGSPYCTSGSAASSNRKLRTYYTYHNSSTNVLNVINK